VTVEAALEPPVWLLDLDDTVFADYPRWSAAPFRATLYADRELKVRWAPGLLRRIRQLHADRSVELRWCTSWCPWAYVVEAALLLPELPRALTDAQCAGSPSQIDAAKVAAAREVLASGRRLIWTDDSAVPRFGPLHEELTADGRALLIAPPPKTGLSPGHMDRIEAFAASR
jgi:hypothetical protein